MPRVTASPVCLAGYPGISLFAGTAAVPLPLPPPAEIPGSFWSPVMGEIAAVPVNCVEQEFLKSSSRPGSVHRRDE